MPMKTTKRQESAAIAVAHPEEFTQPDKLADKKPARKKTFLDKRFEQFVAEVTKAIREGRGSVCFVGRTVEFTYDPKDLGVLMDIKIGDKTFSLADSLEAKSRLAVDGYLGNQLVATGVRCLAAVEERIQRNKVRDARQRLRKLWGDLGDYAWRLNNGATHSPKLAQVTRSMVDYMMAHDGHMPTTFTEAKQAGLQFPFLTHSEWALIKQIAQGAAAYKQRRLRDRAEMEARLAAKQQKQ